jgi:trigger factor
MPQVIQQNIGPQHLMLTITVEKSDYEARLNKRLKEYAAHAQFKGFRPGHVPMSMVKGRVGNAMLAEEINQTVDKSLNDFFQEGKIQIIGNPIPQTEEAPVLNINAPADYTFVFEVGLYPEIEVQGLDASNILEHHVLPVTDADVDEQWESMRKGASSLEDVDDHVQAEDVFSVSLQEIENGEPKADGYSRDAVLLRQQDLSDYYQGAFLGKTLGESVDIEDVLSLEKSADEKIVRRYILDLPAEAPLPGALRATVRGVRRPVPAVVNEAFFQRFFPEHVTTEEQARQFLREAIFSQKNQLSTALLNDRIVLHLLRLNQPELPMAFLEKLILRNTETELEAEQLEKQLQNFAATLRWATIKRTLGTAAQVNVSNQDLDRFIWSYMQENFGFVNQQFFDQFAQRFYDDEKFVQDAAERIFEQKVLQYAAGLVGKQTIESTPEALAEMREELRRETRAIFAADEPAEVETAE